MSVEGVTDAAARVVALAPSIKRAYSSTGSGQAGVYSIPSDITITPIALVRHERFQLAQSGSPEVLKHWVTVELWVGAQNAGLAEKELLPLVTQVISAFRTHVGLFGASTIAKVTEGGPPNDAAVAGKPFIVYPITVLCTELSIQEYTLGPGA